MESTTTTSETISQTTLGHRTLQRKNATRYRETPPKSRNTTPRSSPYRCSAYPKKVNQSPVKLRADEDETDRLVSNRVLADMDREKRSYLGNLEWAEQEERLFEILFLRQEIPLLPLHWEVDFRGVPISGDCFCLKKGVKPIVYAHTSGFRATTALTRLIDLTANVRTACQSGLRQKAPPMIKKCLDKYISWASEDGGYSHLKYTPNITVEIIDKSVEEFDMTSAIEARMRDLARSHRKLLATSPAQQDNTTDPDIDKEVEMQIKNEAEASNEQQPFAKRSRSWRRFGSRMMSKLFRLIRSRPIIKPESHGETSVIEGEDDDPTAAEQSGQAKGFVYVKTEEEEDAGVLIKEEMFDNSDDAITMADLPLALESLSSSSPTYLHPPPVIYGFFVVATNVLLLTADSAKDESSMNLSFHLDMDFQDRGQSMWNAITVAIVACLARDDMMTRMEDFEEERVAEESDPDA
ncbi:hypothetical protein TARUN_7760 [Trichoderma arundinaceum]|uniref:Uncharacterized protein n=1 Tax=Trichoderma arundinaceum TaxID=490622 RepID=A0A395NEW7_TRIAR|nr:hypothetical protein TARUN_7760 [Trichoderma arundinaceum]